jgi:hypothetical protein
MFVEPVALHPIPAYAQIAPSVLDSVLTRLSGAPREQKRAFRVSFRELELRQPALAEYMAAEVAELHAARVQSLGFYLAVLVFRAFEEAFGPRLSRVELVDINRMLALLIADSEVRSWAALGKTYSEDAIALGQPALVSLLRVEVERAVRAAPEEAWEAIDPFYESLLVMVLTLTQAVAP